MWASLLLLLLLALQIGCQPLLMGWFAPQASDVRLRVFVVELLKLALALVPLALRGRLCAELRGWRLATAAQTTVAPALIFVLQNCLNQSAVVLLDGVTFNVFNQTKIIWTAALVYWMLGHAQSRVQVLALAILCGAAVVMALPPSSASASHGERHDESDGGGKSDIGLRETDAAFISGAYQATTAAILSALAGTIIQRALQPQKRDPYMVTIELSVMGQLALLAWVAGEKLWASSSSAAAASLNLSSDRSDVSIWDGWTVMTLVALLSQALGGITVGLVIKHCGNVHKSFAVVLGMLISAGLEHVCNGKPFGVEMVAAVGMVALSAFLYVSHPPTDAAIDLEGVQAGKVDPQPGLFCLTGRSPCTRPIKKPGACAYVEVSAEEDVEAAPAKETSACVSPEIDTSSVKASSTGIAVVAPS